MCLVRFRDVPKVSKKCNFKKMMSKLSTCKKRLRMFNKMIFIIIIELFCLING